MTLKPLPFAFFYKQCVYLEKRPLIFSVCSFLAFNRLAEYFKKVCLLKSYLDLNQYNFDISLPNGVDKIQFVRIILIQ